ncbi:MAG: hypothetical protein SGPRY_006131, partial [Prymnesium sp.]
MVRTMAAGHSPPRLHPLSLRFEEEAVERELREASCEKVRTMAYLLLSVMALMLVAVLVGKNEVVLWAAVLFVGLGVATKAISIMQPSSAHGTFEIAIALMLTVGCGSNCLIGIERMLNGNDTPLNVSASEGMEPNDSASADLRSCPIWEIFVNLFLCLCWSVCNCWLHMGGFVKLMSFFCPILTHAMNPMYAELGGWLQESRMIAAALLAGNLLGYCLERTARLSFLDAREREKLRIALVAHEAEAEATRMRGAAHRVINHTSKRVMCNTVQVCEVAIRQLEAVGFSGSVNAEGPDLISLLKAHSAESIAGFHMCRSVLLRANLSAGHYVPTCEVFSLEELFSELGFTQNSRLVVNVWPRDGPLVCTDKLLLQTILFNAAQNALCHGRAHGKIYAGAELYGESLCIKMRNEAGRNHSTQLSTSRLANEQVGTQTSSYLGLKDIQHACSLSPSFSRASLWVRPTEVVFELNLTVQLRPRAVSPESQRMVPELRPKATADVSHTDGATGSTALPDSSHLYPLPQNIVIVHADDDVMPRIFMETVLQHSNAHPASRILGENYDELVNLPQSVSELATEHGHDRVIVVLDQRLEIPGEPPLHGTDLCRQLRAEFKFEGLVLMLSANDESEACETAKKAGADGLAAKGLHA